MKIVLQKRVDKLGLAGEVKEVAEGYARNFLIPGGLAVIATEAVINEWRHKANLTLRIKEKEITGAKKLAKELNKAVVVIKAKANDAGTLFGAITPDQLVIGLKNQEIELNKKYLNYPEHIKTLGDHEVDYKLADGSVGVFKVKVEKE